MSKTYFKEEQQFNRPVWWVIFIILFSIAMIPFVIGINKQLIQGEPWGDNPMSDTGLIVTTILVFLLMIGLLFLFVKMRLIVEVKEEGIKYSYPPLINKKRSLLRIRIDRFELRKYRPVTEYGGWGVKVGSKKWGKAYNVYGNMGMQFYLKDGAKILFGTQRGEAFLRAVQKMMENRVF